MKLNIFLMTILSLFALSANAADKAEELYTKHCKKCHASDGSGMKDGKPLAVVKTLKIVDKPELLNLLREDAKKQTDQQIADSILKGKDKSDKGPGMKAIKNVTPEDANELVQYVRKLQAAAK